MTRIAITVLIIALARGAAAQAPEQGEPPRAASLEDRVSAQLASEGIALARHRLALRIEPAAERWVVSVVDLATGRVAAWSTVEHPPEADDAAVALAARAAADLVARIAERAEGPESARPDPPRPVPADIAERMQRERTELAFRRRAIRFSASDGVDGTRAPTGNWSWRLIRGELDQELDPPAFYHAVGRDDLGQAYLRRRSLMIGGYVLAATTLAVSGAIALFDPRDACVRQTVPDGHGRCIAVQSSSLAPLWILLGAGVTGALVGTYFAVVPQPIDDDEARALADAYNRRLRRRLGLPMASRRSLLRQVQVMPLLAARKAGILLGAQF